MTPYEASINEFLEKCKAWILENKVEELPDSLSDCPKGCPLWTGGLSRAQAGGIYGAMKNFVRQRGGTIGPRKD